LINETRIQVYAVLLGERINTRQLPLADKLATAPLALATGKAGISIILRFGAVVFFNQTEAERKAFLERLMPFVDRAYPQPLHDTLEIRVDPEGKDSLCADCVVIVRPNVERLQLIAETLAKSLILDLYEERLASAFDHIEPMAQRLRSRLGRRWRLSELTDQIGLSLLTEHHMVGRVETKEKPELLWEHPELEGFHLRLFDEYELDERSVALEQKLDLITRTVETLLRLEESRRSLRAEWYIILLIVVEILLTLYELFVHR
jgi:uncharacterized Rmd1/YagE family protein